MNFRFALIRSTLGIAVAATATLLTVIGSAAPAAAAPITDAPRSVTIDLRGIDLTSPAGAARVKSAISRAVRQVCTTGDQRQPSAVSERARCIRAAYADVRPKFDALAADARAARTAVADAAPTDQVRR